MMLASEEGGGRKAVSVLITGGNGANGTTNAGGAGGSR